MFLRFSSKLALPLLQKTSSPPASFLIITPLLTNLSICRQRHTKHWLPKWKPLRRLKVLKVKLPDFSENSDSFSEDEIRTKLKEQGLVPPRPWVETQFFISSTGGVFEAYVPPEGDGKISPLSAQGAKQKLQLLEKKSKTMMAIRKVRTFDDDFDTQDFCNKAESIYIKMHELITTNKDLDTNMTKYCTERAYPEVIHNISNKTIHWKFIKNIESPRVVHARCTDVVTKENIFAQLTVRFHTQQILAIYDRFGRLMHGSEIIAKDVLEYVVFEKHMANEYGVWRIHDKIIPDWMPPMQPTKITYRKRAKFETKLENNPETVPQQLQSATKENINNLEITATSNNKTNITVPTV